MPVYASGVLKAEAGSQKPIVHINKVGISDTSGLTAVQIGLTSALKAGTQITNF